MFARLGRLVTRHPWRVIAVWIIAAIVIIALAPKLKSSANEASFLPGHYESVKAQNLQQAAFPEAAAPAAIIVFEHAGGGKLTATDSAAIRSIGSKLAADHIKSVTAVQPGQPSANRLVQTIGIQMRLANNAQDTNQIDAVKALRARLPGALHGTGLKAGITGTAAQNLDAQNSNNKASVIIGGATIGLIIILLLVIFRSPVITLLPILTIGLVSQMANGLIGWASKAFDLKTDSSVTSLLIVVLFGIGTDYILFLMFRYRERLREGDDHKAGMVQALTRAGEAIASAAGAVIVAFMALVLSTLALFRSLGPALAIAVAVTMLAALTLIPAIASLLGPRVFWPSKAWRKEPEGARFAAIGRAMGRRPAAFAAVSGLVLIALGVAALGLHSTFNLTATSSSSPSTLWSKQLLRGEPAGATDPAEVLVRSTNGQRLSQAELTAYRTKLAAAPGVAQTGNAQLSKSGQVADYQLTLSDDPNSAAAIGVIKKTLRPAAHRHAPPGTTVVVGGTTAVYADIQTAVNHDYGVVFPVAAIIIMIILGLVLRSAVAPWYLMASVGLGFAATLGATVLVFQDIGSDAGLIFMMPIIMYMFVVALGTDYNILMITRLREEAREGNTPRAAVARAVQHAGPTIASAGLILAGSFASLMLAGQSLLTQMGFAISLGIVIAAYVMSMFFTPSLTALIGHAAWWPGHEDTAQPPADREPVTADASEPALH